MFLLQPEFLYLKSGEKLTQLNLVIPGLCGPLPDIDRLDSESIQSLIKHLSKSDKNELSQKSFYEVLAQLFYLDECKPFPAAALSLLANDQYVEQGYWFRADPVHLQADMDHAILRDSHGLDLSLEESEALIAELNAYFHDDGIRFLVNDKNSWVININDHEKVSTTPVHDVISRNVYSFMPMGEDALYWKKFMNEVQMLLYQSSVNERREENNKLSINGVWLWGEGDLPVKSRVKNLVVYSQHSMVKGLAILNELDCHVVSDSKTFIDQVSNDEENLLVLDDLFNMTCYGDVLAWQSSFNVLYKDWLEPIFNWAKKNRVKINLHPCDGVSYHISGKNTFRLFRDNRLETYIKTYE